MGVQRWECPFDRFGKIALHLRIGVKEVGKIPRKATLSDQVGK
jgi:hypothetical protein